MRWNRMPEPAELPWKDRLRDLLLRAEIEVDLKGQIMEAAERNGDRVGFLAELHGLRCPEALFGAVLELLSAG